MSVAGEFPTLWQAASVFGLGVLPVAEGNVAVPVGLALGMNPIVAVLISVSGTTSQTLLVRGLASWLLSLPRVSRWWERRWTGRTRQLFEWQGVTWVVLIGIPWLGGVPTALGAQLAGIGFGRYARWAVGGLVLHAAILALFIRLGVYAVGKR